MGAGVGAVRILKSKLYIYMTFELAPQSLAGIHNGILSQTTERVDVTTTWSDTSLCPRFGVPHAWCPPLGLVVRTLSLVAPGSPTLDITTHTLPEVALKSVGLFEYGSVYHDLLMSPLRPRSGTAACGAVRQLGALDLRRGRPACDATP